MSKLKASKWICVLFVFCAATAVALLARATTDAPPATTFTTLHSFDGTDGNGPVAGLVQGSDGSFYGTTAEGGANSNINCSLGGSHVSCGTVFKITTNGKLTTLHNFCHPPTSSGCPDGEYPSTGLVLGTDGSFYGTTRGGGANCSPYGCGTVFKINPSGALTTLYSFCSQTNCRDGKYPYATLVQGTDGNFHGTTEQGGAGDNCPGIKAGCGTVFSITPGGTLATLHSFDLSDGAYPLAGLVHSTNGKFYGTTDNGGTGNSCILDCGTVFSITAAGTLRTLHNFDGTDGEAPHAGLVQGTDENFYGTTVVGGLYIGTVFKITPSGTLTTLHSFGYGDGAYPYAALVQGTDGKFYGTTWGGGANGGGTVFSMTASGTLTTLYNFCSRPPYCMDGESPYAGLLQGTDGKFYGTTSQGGANRYYGTVYSLSVGLGPFVKVQPTSGEVGATVRILGTNLTGATSVTFNGTAATFTLKSKSEITTTVPIGATSGTVQVVTPGATLSSNVPFRVLP